MSDITAKPALGNPHMLVILVDDTSTKIPAVLGITPEREEELDILTKEKFESENTITDTMAELSKYLKHANELAYCMFHIGANVGRSKAMDSRLAGLLGKLREEFGINDGPTEENED